MSPEMRTTGFSNNGAPGPGEHVLQSWLEASPFAGATLEAEPAVAAGLSEAANVESITTPFTEALASMQEVDLEAEAFEALRAEFEDEDFTEALEALANEIAARHLTAVGGWGQQAEAMHLADTEAESWMGAVAARADHLFAELEAHFGNRPVESLGPGEIESVAGFAGTQQESFGTPLDSQELFFGSLIKKVGQVVSGVGKLVKKGVQAVGKVLPLGKLFSILKKLVGPLLEKVLRKAIGKLPAALRPIASKLAGQFGLGGATPSTRRGKPSTTAATAAAEQSAADAPTDGESPWSVEALAEDFDSRLAEAVLTPHEAATDQLLAQFEAEDRRTSDFLVDGPFSALDTGRQRLARQLVDSAPARPPLSEIQDFIPVVLAALPLIKIGIGVIGRPKVVDFVAKLLANLLKSMVGAQAATLLSRHIADTGLGLLGLEAERTPDGTLGAEALVATTEDTIREVFSLPTASLQNNLLVETAVGEAFTAAAIRHFPPAVLRADLSEPAAGGGRGVWLMYPRETRPHYRYKKYSEVQPVLFTRGLARSVLLSDGETLEDRLLDAGAHSWPVQAEAHFYELLPGTELGHLAAFETESAGFPAGQTALEFEELSADRPPPFAHPGAGSSRGRSGAATAPRSRRRPGNRVFRLKVDGLRLQRRRPFALRLDLSAGKPTLHLHLHVSERLAHELIGHLEKQQMAPVVAAIRALLGEPAQQALAARLHAMLKSRQITLAEGGSAKLADAMAEAMTRALAAQLPAAAAALTSAAKEPTAGVTLSFAFSFADRAAIADSKFEDPTLSIHSGVHSG